MRQTYFDKYDDMERIIEFDGLSKEQLCELVEALFDHLDKDPMVLMDSHGEKRITIVDKW